MRQGAVAVQRLALGRRNFAANLPSSASFLDRAHMTEERRRHRSTEPAQALSLLLDACRERGSFEAIVVSDDAGLLVAATSVEDPSFTMNAEEIAAVLPEPSERVSIRRLRTTAFGVDGHLLYVGAIGGDRASFAPTVQATLRGVRRILAA